MRQHGQFLAVMGARRVQGFQHVVLLCVCISRVIHPLDLVEDVDAIVGNGLRYLKAVNSVAHFQPRRNGQAIGKAILILQGGVQQALHPHHQGRDVVLTAGFERRLDQGLAGGLGVVAQRQRLQFAV